MIPGVMVPIVLFVTAGAVTIFYPLARAAARKMEREADTDLPPHVAQRLERMEHAIDAIAEQVERVAEGQRFTTKLLSERAASRSPELPGA